MTESRQQRQIVRRPCIRAIIFAALVLAMQEVGAATILRVDASATDPSPDGSSWVEAFPTLGAALAAAGADTEIWVAEAAQPYLPDSSGLPDPRSATFEIPSGVAVYGGFRGLAAGGLETQRSQRDPVANVTTLGGDLARNDGPFLFTNIGENAYHVVSMHAADETAVLDGVRIVAGHANGVDPDNSGGGILIDSGAPRIVGCRIARCIAIDRGAAAIVFGGNANFVDCEIVENAGAVQGALTTVGTGAVLVDRCRFLRNGFYDPLPIIDGPALTVMENVTLTIRDCDFIDNRGECSGGAVYSGLGPSVIRVERCRFLGNRIEADIGRGGGIRNAANMAVIDCEFRANMVISDFGEPALGGAFQNEGTAVLVNCEMLGNRVVGDGEFIAGGAVDSTNDLTIINSTIVGNGGPLYAGILARGAASNVAVQNSIVWGNRGQFTGDIEADQHATTQGGFVSVDYSCIEGLSVATGGVGNIGSDPSFVDPLGTDSIAGTGDEDVRLAAGSPCIDAADNGAVPMTITTDLFGALRVVDDSAVADTGVGPAPVVDMGAYEHFRSGDLNCDGTTDAVDIPLLVTALLSPGDFSGCDPRRADVNADAAIDGHDIRAFVATILQ